MPKKMIDIAQELLKENKKYIGDPGKWSKGGTNKAKFRLRYIVGYLELAAIQEKRNTPF